MLALMATVLLSAAFMFACGGETITIVETVVVEKQVEVIVEKAVTVTEKGKDVIIIQTAVPVPAKDAPKPSVWGGTLRLAAHGP
ncbi:MAG: hypothetical protein OSB68_06165, partial [Dehalococcoidia bacterium]|nr:hypothetical protein [Dehalococcoidia bacterium]